VGRFAGRVAVGADVADEAAVDAMFARTVEADGQLDILINNPGITRDILLFGNRGQVNYPAAKVGVQGLTATLAIDAFLAIDDPSYVSGQTGYVNGGAR
jgi:NAD(P)-dependent dehydrogenase (short-subunit alcohol dehydrogenase family)